MILHARILLNSSCSIYKHLMMKFMLTIIIINIINIVTIIIINIKKYVHSKQNPKIQ